MFEGLKEVTVTRLGPMSQLVRIEASVHFKEIIQCLIEREVMTGYIDHDQKSFSTYIMLENAYVGCLRYNDDPVMRSVIWLKMYNSVADDTRAICNKVLAKLGSEYNPLLSCMRCGVQSSLENLELILDVWISEQFKAPLMEYPKNPFDPAKKPFETVVTDSNVTGVIRYADYFLKLSANSYTKKVAESILFMDKDDYPIAIGYFDGTGAGEIWRCVVPVTYGTFNEVIRPSIWRKCLQWFEYPESGADVVGATELLDEIFNQQHKVGMIKAFPTPKR